MARGWSHVAMAAVMLAACAPGREAATGGSSPPPDEAAFPMTFTDDEGVEVTVEAVPRRIVTFAPSHTEIVFALGLDERLVGVAGPFDDHPTEALELPRVAGAGGIEPNIERVVSLEPDVVLTAFIGGEWKARVRELGIPVVTTLASSFDDALEDIATIGRVLGVPDEAEGLAMGMADQAAEMSAQVGAVEPVSCFLDLSDLYTVGPGSLEFDLLRRAGCDPVTAGADDPYPQWSLEQLLEDDPDVYLVSEGVSVDQLRRQPGIRDLTAVRQGRVHEVSGDLISRPGPRLVEGIRALAEALHGQPVAA